MDKQVEVTVTIAAKAAGDVGPVMATYTVGGDSLNAAADEAFTRAYLDLLAMGQVMQARREGRPVAGVAEKVKARDWRTFREYLRSGREASDTPAVVG